MIFLVRGVSLAFFSGAFFGEIERIAGWKNYDFLGQGGIPCFFFRAHFLVKWDGGQYQGQT